MADEEGDASGEDESTDSQQVDCSKNPNKLKPEAFFNNLTKLQTYIQEAKTNPENASLEPDKVKNMVTTMNAEVDCLRRYCEATQAQVESVLHPIQDITKQIAASIPHDLGGGGGGGQSVAKLEAELRKKTANAQLAAINESLLKGMKLLAQTESTVAEANVAVIHALDTAKRVQEEAEKQRKAEIEAQRLAEEQRHADEEKKKLEMAKRAEQALIDAEILRKRAEEGETEIHPMKLAIEQVYEFDAGIGCLLYSELMTADQVICEVVELLDAGFDFQPNEELISHIIRLSPADDGITVRGPLEIAIPHAMTRAQASIREPVIKVQVVDDGPWKDLKTVDVMVDSYKDIKFASVKDFRQFGTFAVTSRFKKHVLKFKKHGGGTTTSNIDPRIKVKYESDTFFMREKLQLQLQPVEQSSMNELRQTLDVAKGLLCSTAIFHAVWKNATFEELLTITMPLAPNPVAARKLAASRSAKGDKEAAEREGEKPVSGAGRNKEAKAAAKAEGATEGAQEEVDRMKAEAKPAKVATDDDDDDDDDDDEADTQGGRKRRKKDDDSAEKKAMWLKPVKWYMGIYGKNEEDERDQLFFVMYNPAESTWQVKPVKLKYLDADQTVVVKLAAPVDTFAVFRVSMMCTERDVVRIANALDQVLGRKKVQFVVKQHMINSCNLTAYVVVTPKVERLVRDLEEREYDEGPEPSKEFTMTEGEKIFIAFRGNIRCVDSNPVLKAIWTSNLERSFNVLVSANDIYVQKSYKVYRGFIQLKCFYKVPVTAIEVKKVPTGKKKPDDHRRSSIARVSNFDEHPVFVLKEKILTELLVTFPKDQIASASTIKTPITYHPAGDAVTPRLLLKLSEQLHRADEWNSVVESLGINHNLMLVIRRNGELKRMSEKDIKLEILLQWIKVLQKGRNKLELIREALRVANRAELCAVLDGHIATERAMAADIADVVRDKSSNQATTDGKEIRLHFAGNAN